MYPGFYLTLAALVFALIAVVLAMFAALIAADRASQQYVNQEVARQLDARDEIKGENYYRGRFW